MIFHKTGYFSSEGYIFINSMNFHQSDTLRNYLFININKFIYIIRLKFLLSFDLNLNFWLSLAHLSPSLFCSWLSMEGWSLISLVCVPLWNQDHLLFFFLYLWEFQKFSLNFEAFRPSFSLPVCCVISLAFLTPKDHSYN